MNNQYRAGITVVDTDEKAHEVLTFLESHEGTVGIDTETEGVNPRKQSPVNNGRVVCWSLAWESRYRHDVWGTPLAHRVFLWAKYLEVFRGYLEDSRKPKVGHNVFTFDRHALSRSGINLQGVVGDTLRMSKLLSSDKRVDHSLKGLMYLYFGYKLGEYKELFTRPKRLESKFTQSKVTGPDLFGEVTSGKWCRRKIQGKYVKTWVEDGEHCRFSYSAREFIPLSRIWVDYPELLAKLYDYASLDAKATLELYWALRKKLEGKEWKRG